MYIVIFFKKNGKFIKNFLNFLWEFYIFNINWKKKIWILWIKIKINCLIVNINIGVKVYDMYWMGISSSLIG